MKRLAFLSFLVGICAFFSARADLTIVQKIEGPGGGEMTVKIRGGKARIDSGSKTTTLIDSKTGEITQLMNDQKAVVHISAEKMRAAMEMMNKFETNPKATAKPALTPTGKKETINGYETEQYVCQAPSFKATYWIASKYPNAAIILKQLQVLNSSAWRPQNMEVPDYSDFPGVPLKFVISAGGNELTTTLTSLKEGEVDESEFAIPSDFHEVKIPDIQAGSAQTSPVENKPVSPTP